MKTPVVNISTIKQVVAGAAAEMPIARVYLFGSQARGEANETSDIDLCLETLPGFSLIDAGFFEDKVSSYFGRDVDVVSAACFTPTTRKNLMRDRVLVYER